MPDARPFPELDELLRSTGAGGSRISDVDASEAGAGNISVHAGWDVEGSGVLPFLVAGSEGMMKANVEGLREHQIVLWSKHGIMARSDVSVTRAVDRIEYAETGARYEYMNIVAGGRAEGLTDAEIAEVAAEFGIVSPWVH